MSYIQRLIRIIVSLGGITNNLILGLVWKLSFMVDLKNWDSGFAKTEFNKFCDSAFYIWYKFCCTQCLMTFLNNLIILNLVINNN